MTKLLSTLVLLVLGVAAIAVAAPSLAKLVAAAVPLVLVLGIVAAVLRVVWFLTR